MSIYNHLKNPQLHVRCVNDDATFSHLSALTEFLNEKQYLKMKESESFLHTPCLSLWIRWLTLSTLLSFSPSVVTYSRTCSNSCARCRIMYTAARLWKDVDIRPSIPWRLLRWIENSFRKHKWFQYKLRIWLENNIESYRSNVTKC